MPVTMATVRALLDVDEPKYVEAAELGPPALPFLEKLVHDADPMLASKAAYLASLIEGQHAEAIVKTAAKSPHAVVRVAAAAAARNLPAAAAETVLGTLKTDDDAGVRKTVARASPAARSTPPPLSAGAPAPPESGGGSFGPDVLYDTARGVTTGAMGDGGGSAHAGGDGSTNGTSGDGGGSVAGSTTAVGVGGEGGGG